MKRPRHCQSGDAESGTHWLGTWSPTDGDVKRISPQQRFSWRLPQETGRQTGRTARVQALMLGAVLEVKDRGRDEPSTDRVNHLWVDGLRDDAPVVGDVLHHLAQSCPFHLLPF